MALKVLLLISIASLIGCGQAGTAVGAEDIAGLKIGMTPEEARLQLSRINPKFNIVESRARGWNAIVLMATDSSELIRIEFTVTKPGAWFIGRSIAFPVGQRPTLEGMRKDLIEKYGPPTIETPWGGVALNWHTSTPKSNQNPTRPGDPPPLLRCDYRINPDISWSERGLLPFNMRSPSIECDKMIQLSWVERGSLVENLAVTITNFALVRVDPMNPSHAAETNERKKIEEARKIKPKL